METDPQIIAHRSNWFCSLQWKDQLFHLKLMTFQTQLGFGEHWCNFFYKNDLCLHVDRREKKGWENEGRERGCHATKSWSVWRCVGYKYISVFKTPDLSWHCSVGGLLRDCLWFWAIKQTWLEVTWLQRQHFHLYFTSLWFHCVSWLCCMFLIQSSSKTHETFITKVQGWPPDR